MLKKAISLFLSLSLIITQSIFAQGVAQLNLAQYLGQARPAATDSFRPAQLRYFSYDNLNNSFRILLDKGDAKDIKDNQLKEQAKELMDYFLIGVTLPNDAFWVNLRPDSPDNIIDPELEQTGLGRILLEADLQLKKDTASLTSPQTPEGKAYWDKLYKKAGELFGSENITIPTLTRPWIVPREIIVRESGNSAYIYKATLKVLLEQDHLKDSAVYNFPDPRLKELNEYSSQIIRETIIPKLTQEVNSSKRYAQLRQVYYSLVLSRWFKQKFGTRAPGHKSTSADYISLIDSGNLTNLTAKEPYDKLSYFKQYQESFAKGEYNLKEPVYTPYGQSIRTYMSGGFFAGHGAIKFSGVETTVGSSIVEESLKNHNNIVSLKVSEPGSRIELSDQEQPLALAASPVEFYNEIEAERWVKENLKAESIYGHEEDLIPEKDFLEMIKLFKSIIQKIPKTIYIDRVFGKIAHMILDMGEDYPYHEKYYVIEQIVVVENKQEKVLIDSKDWREAIIQFLVNIVVDDSKEYALAKKGDFIKKWMLRENASRLFGKYEYEDDVFRNALTEWYKEKFIPDHISEKLTKRERVYFQEYFSGAASPLGKELLVTDIYGRPLRYVYYRKLSDEGKSSLLEAFGKSFSDWGIKAADKNLRFAVRVNKANKIVAVVGALQYNIDTKEVGIRIVPKGVDKALEIESSLRKAYSEEIAQGERLFWDKTISSSVASPLSVPEIKIKAKEAVVNVGKSLRQYIFSDEAQNKYNLSAEYIDKLETIKLWLWLENAIKFFNDKISNPSSEAAVDSGRIVSTYKYLIGELKQHASVTSQLIKDIYGTFRARTINSADDGEAILRAILAMGKEENISKEELDIAVEILTPLQVDRVVPVWKIIETLKQFSIGGIQNQETPSIQMAILNVLIDDNYPGCAFLRKERLEHFLRYAKTLVEKNYLDAAEVRLIESAIEDKTYGKALNIVMNLSKERMGQASSEEVAEFKRRQANVDIDNSIPTLSRIVEVHINNKDSLLSKEDKERVSNMYTASSAASPLRQAKLKDVGPADVATGGIDFTARAMKIGLERVGSFAGLKLVLPEISNVAAIDLDNEFKQIQIMATSGIRPSDIRILEFAAACYYRGEFGPRLGEITACLQQAHFLDERIGRESSEVLRLATMLPEVM